MLFVNIHYKISGKNIKSKFELNPMAGSDIWRSVLCTQFSQVWSSTTNEIMAVALQVSNISSLVSPPSITSPPFILLPSSKLNSNSNKAYGSIHTTNFKSFRVLYRYSANEEDDKDGENCSFDEAVALFNERAYYKCHDCLESLWYTAEEPTRTLIHGVLQCAVGFYHLFNQVT